MSYLVVSADNPWKGKGLAGLYAKRLPTIPVGNARNSGESFGLSAVLVLRSPLHKVVRGPGAGELHTAVLQLLSGRGVFVLIAFDRFVIDQMRDVQQHLACVHPLAGDLFGKRQEHTMHLD